MDTERYIDYEGQHVQRICTSPEIEYQFQLSRIPVPPFGYLRELRVRPVNGPIPNMDASNPITMNLSLWTPHGGSIPYIVEMNCYPVLSEPRI